MRLILTCLTIVTAMFACSFCCVSVSWGDGQTPTTQPSTQPAEAGTEIIEAAKSGDLEKIKTLLKANPSLISCVDNNGDTALHWAAASDHKEMAEFLLANKADANVKANSGNTPLHTAAYFGHIEIMNLLLANKADVNAKNNNGETPLNLAVANSHDDVADVLRQHGAIASAPSEVDGLVKEVDISKRTITVVPWNQAGAAYNREHPRVLTLDKNTLIHGDQSEATVADIEAGTGTAAISTQTISDIMAGRGSADLPADVIRSLGDLRGRKVEVHCDSNGVPRRIEFVIMFGGESVPAMVGPNGAVPTP
jgi:hypothetical protein